MNSDSLHALLIDQHCGELSPEVAELLEAHLQRDPRARREADRIRTALGATQQALQRHPELARVRPPGVVAGVGARLRGWAMSRPLRAAAVLVLLASATVGGYVAGRVQPTLGARSAVAASSPLSPASVTAASAVTPATAPAPGPWARYRMRWDPLRQAPQVVRVDAASFSKGGTP